VFDSGTCHAHIGIELVVSGVGVSLAPLRNFRKMIERLENGLARRRRFPSEDKRVDDQTSVREVVPNFANPVIAGAHVLSQQRERRGR
jgi:hypothetical protein